MTTAETRDLERYQRDKTGDQTDADQRQHARHCRRGQLVELGYARARIWHVLDHLDDDPAAVAALLAVLVDVGRREFVLLDRLRV